MAIYNIRMKKRNGSNWDTLYPITMASNIYTSDGYTIQEKIDNGTIGEGSGSATIERYSRFHTVTEPTTTVDIDILAYDRMTDKLSIYLSGVRLIPDVDYTQDKDTDTITMISGTLEKDSLLYIEVLKSRKNYGGTGTTGTTGGLVTSTDLPDAEHRAEGSVYFKITGTLTSVVDNGLIKVSPNMGLKVMEIGE